MNPPHQLQSAARMHDAERGHGATEARVCVCLSAGCPHDHPRSEGRAAAEAQERRDRLGEENSPFSSLSPSSRRHEHRLL